MQTPPISSRIALRMGKMLEALTTPEEEEKKKHSGEERCVIITTSGRFNKKAKKPLQLKTTKQTRRKHVHAHTLAILSHLGQPGHRRQNAN